MIAALFVATGGCYFGLSYVDPWDESRDARKYIDTYAVVAHPPCEHWGRYWSGGPSARERKVKGDDAGCFASALASVRRCGGVLEHPEATHAWSAHGLEKPPRKGGWVRADNHGWTCCVEQGAYGHLARKATWLYAVQTALPDLIWRSTHEHIRLDAGFHSSAERARAIKTGVCQRLSKKQRMATPTDFRDVLISMARSVHS